MSGDNEFGRPCAARVRPSRLPKTSRPGLGVLLASVFGSGVCGLATGARAQLAGGGLTDTGYTGGAGPSLRDTVGSLLAARESGSTVRPWTFSGDVDVQVGATDSAGDTGGGWQPLILLSPDLNLNGVTSRLNVALNYSPRLSLYPSTSSQTYLSQDFNGSAAAVIVPDLLFLNARGLSSVSSRFGDTSVVSNSFVSQNDAVQTSSFSVSPYVSRQIGGYGTVTVGYSYARTFQDGNTGFQNYNNAFASNLFTTNSGSAAGYGTTGNLETNTEYGSFTTGENLGRVQDSIQATASQNGGSTFYQGSNTLSASNTVSYSVYRWLALLASVGYEEYNYPQAGYRLNEPTWSVGVTLTPNPDSSITVQYGQTAGENTVLANGTYSPTPRTRVYGSYTVGIQTGLGGRQSLLGSTTVGPGGLLVDQLTGAPNLANNYLASQYPLSRVSTFTIGGLLLLDRDTFTASVNNSSVQQLVGSTDILGVATSAGTTTDITYATLNWQHDLNPSTSLSSGVTYSTTNNGIYLGTPGTAQDTLQVYSALTHSFTDTVSGSLTYSHSERFGDAARNLPTSFGGPASQNVVLVGLRKSF